MIKKLLKFSYIVVVVGLLFAQYAWTAPANEYFVPAPLEPELSSDGKALYNAVLPVIYVNDPNPSYEPMRIPAPIDLLNPPESATATFSITYVPNGGADPWSEACYTFPEEAKAAFNAAANIWANILQSSVPITISACWADLGSSSTLGYSGGGPWRRDFAGAPRANTWYVGSLANALGGTDLDPSQFDMHITYNKNFSWYYGTDGNTPAGQHDLVTVVLHEIGHGLNFSGSMSYSGGQGSWGSGGYPNIYDTFIRDGAGNQLINTGVYTNPSAALGSALTSNDIWFHGSNAMAANSGQRVKIYAPSTWSSGSSYAHLDYNTFNDTANELMVYAVSSGESVHDPGPVTKGLFKDLGWTIPSGTTCTYSISPTSQSFDSNGGTGSVTVTTTSGCSWTATSNASWVIITSNSSGTGSGTVNYSVSQNTGSSRSGTITIAGQTFTVSQTGTTTEVSLTNNVPVNDSITGSSPQTAWKYYYIDITSGTTNLVIDLYNLSGDADLYVRNGSKPTTSAYDCRPWQSGTTNEQCSNSSPSAGRWWVGVNNYDTGTTTYTIRATWSGGTVGVFTDVPISHWAYNYIMAIYNAHITTGCSQSPLKYCPESNVTRDQMAAFIVRAKEGEPAANYCSAGSPFPDVEKDNWACGYIKRLKELGITTGYSDGRYGPLDTVTREQMAAFLVRAKEGEPAANYCGTGSQFSDVSSGSWACKYIKRLYELAITTGCGTNPLRYCPLDLVTRAQMAAFLARAFLGMQ